MDDKWLIHDLIWHKTIYHLQKSKRKSISTLFWLKIASSSLDIVYLYLANPPFKKNKQVAWSWSHEIHEEYTFTLNRDRRRRRKEEGLASQWSGTRVSGMLLTVPTGVRVQYGGSQDRWTRPTGRAPTKNTFADVLLPLCSGHSVCGLPPAAPPCLPCPPCLPKHFVTAVVFTHAPITACFRLQFVSCALRIVCWFVHIDYVLPQLGSLVSFRHTAQVLRAWYTSSFISFSSGLRALHCRVLARNYPAPKCCPERILLREENARICSVIAC
jgi:hypothetical protein